MKRRSPTDSHTSLSSRHTLDDKIQRWLKDGLITVPHFRVLTWRPDESYRAGAAAGLADHLNLDADTFKQNIDYAWDKWKELEEEYKFIEVYGYSSIPTAQAICTDAYIKVELLPFNRARKYGFHECGDHENRPALLMSALNNPNSFRFFRDWFEDLWFSAMAATANRNENLVHERWRAQRLTLLRDRGMLL